MGKRRYNPEQSRERILEAAFAAFSEQGFGGARVDAIAERARVNKRMLYHYFGNKAELYTAVLERAYADIRSHEQELDLDHLAPEDAIRELVAFTFDYFVHTPRFIRLLNDENLYGAEHVRSSPRIPALHPPLIELIDTVVKHGQRQGLFRDDVDAMQLYITIAAVGYFYLSNAHTLGTIFSRNLLSRGALKARREHCVEVVMGYLRP